MLFKIRQPFRRRTLEDALISGCIGAFIFWWFTGASILNPANLNWILSSHSDPVQHYVGWQFFRHGNFLQWPFGSNPAYGEQISSSIVFTDSIPLFAFLFKPFSPILPTEFQYFGIWILCCFALQAIFAWKILSRFTSDRVLLVFSTGLMTLSPAMLWRLNGHEALLGQWLILAGISVFLTHQKKTLNWTILLCLASLVHAYLLAMVASIWLTDVLRRGAFGHIKLTSLLAQVCISISFLLFTMWGAGYFFPGTVTTAGYGWFRMDLFSFVNPLDVWSAFFTGVTREGDYEGFGYLGAGILGTIAIVILVCLITRKRIVVRNDVVVPLALLCGGLLTYAISGHVTAGSHAMLSYDPPKILGPLTSTFRASGRFVWPVIYLLEVGVFVLLFQKIAARPAKFLLAAMLLVQVVDLSHASAAFKARWAQTWTTPLKSAFWSQVPQQYGKIAFAIPTSDMGGYGPLALLAAHNTMTINGGEIARMNAAGLAGSQDTVSSVVGGGNYAAETLYVFTKDYLWQQALLNAKKSDFIGWVDGYRVLAPSWKGCTQTCGLVRAKAAPVPSGTTIDFSVSGTSDQYLGDGWAGAEGQGRWTDQNRATITVWLGKPTTHTKIRFELWALVNASHPVQRVDAIVNGASVAKWTFSDSAGVAPEIDLDPSAIASKDGFATITFQLPDAVSPKAIGMADDTRNLAVFVKKMTISY